MTEEKEQLQQKNLYKKLYIARSLNLNGMQRMDKLDI